MLSDVWHRIDAVVAAIPKVVVDAVGKIPIFLSPRM
jgi:hypothetical protein